MKNTQMAPTFYNAVLQSAFEWQDAVSELRQKKLPLHEDPPKNWDSLAALKIICHHFGDNKKDISIMDAGGEFYSSILPQLEVCGYSRLKCVNLTMNESKRAGNIEYEYGDITDLPHGDASFESVTCLSVIEHGVDTSRFLQEMNRILKPGGLLIVSADYWEETVDAGGQMAFGHPFKIFNREEMKLIARQAVACGFEPMGDMELDCNEKVINCLGLDYTFIFFTLKKTA